MGAVTVLGVFLVILFLAVAALLIDIIRIERAALTMQQAADASSLAAATLLKPKPVAEPNMQEGIDMQLRWRAAKVVVFDTIRENPIFGGADGLELSPSELSCAQSIEGPDNAPWDCQEYRFPSLENPRLTVKVERGIYYTATNESGGKERRFASMEGVLNCCDSEPCRDVIPACTPAVILSGPSVSNGVRVTLIQHEIPTVLARVFDRTLVSVRNVERSAVSAKSAY